MDSIWKIGHPESKLIVHVQILKYKTKAMKHQISKRIILIICDSNNQQQCMHNNKTNRKTIGKKKKISGKILNMEFISDNLNGQDFFLIRKS